MGAKVSNEKYHNEKNTDISATLSTEGFLLEVEEKLFGLRKNFERKIFEGC